MKRKLVVTQFPDQNRYTKFLLIMSLTLGLNLTGTVAFSADSSSESNSFSMNFEKTKIKDIFRSIESQSDYRFFYNDELSDLNRIVDLNVKDLNIREVLDQLFQNSGISYTIMENNLIVIAPVRSEQQKKVSGTVIDGNTGEPLPGVSIAIEGTTQGAISDINGDFTLELTDTSAVIVFTYVGFLTEKIKVGNQSTINIQLVADISELNEVVIVGYGTQKKLTVTGSVASAKGEDIADSPVANISNSLAGRISGISMKSNGGQPGQDNPDIHIRGIGTIGYTNPLVVVDGIIRDNINQIDQNTIESVTVLKDAAAVAPYGMGGANGVLLITTKSGKAGEPSLSFSTYFGMQTPNYVPEMLSAKDYLILTDSVNGNNANALLISRYDSLHAVDPDAYPSSSFYKDVVDLYVPVQSYNLQLTGGDERTKYYAGLGYYKQDGMFENLGYKRYRYNLKVESEATRTTRVIASIQGSIEDIERTQKNADDILWAAVKFIPTDAMKYSNGYWGASDGNSPIGNIKTGGYNNTDKNTLLSTLSIEQQLPFIKGLSLKASFSYDPNESMDKSWSTPVSYYQLDDPAVYPHTYEEIKGASATTLTETYTKSVKYTYQGYINYKNTFGKHEITLLGVAEAQKQTWKNLSASNLDYTILIDEINLGSSDNNYFGIGGGSKTGSQIGLVYRVGYNYDNKYMLEAAGRYDGHYTFAPGHRFGFFPSFSGAWRISEESFLKDKLNWLQSLKFRGSWGKSGNLPWDTKNNRLAEFYYLNGYTLYPNTDRTDPAYAFGSGNLVAGSYIPFESNPAITWEAATKWDAGLDLSLFRGMLTVEADYYHEDRNNMLLNPRSSVSHEYGLALALKNAGVMSNNGIEFSATGSYKLQNGINLGLTGNYSYAKNEMIKTFEDPSTYANPNRRETGRQFETPFGYHSEGLFTTADDINGDDRIDSLDGYNVIQFGVVRPGDVRFADLSGPDGVPDGIIDPNDMTVIGYPRYPSVTYGFTPTFAWKGIDVSLFFQGTAKVSMYIANFQTQPFANNKSNTSYEYFDNYWNRGREDGIYPRVETQLNINNTQYSDFWMRDASYLRLKNAVVGYTIPNKITNRVGIKSFRAYFSGQNLLTFSKVKFMDPEEAERNTAATYFYPITKVYTLGFDITF